MVWARFTPSRPSSEQRVQWCFFYREHNHFKLSFFSVPSAWISPDRATKSHFYRNIVKSLCWKTFFKALELQSLSDSYHYSSLLRKERQWQPEICYLREQQQLQLPSEEIRISVIVFCFLAIVIDLSFLKDSHEFRWYRSASSLAAFSHCPCIPWKALKLHWSPWTSVPLCCLHTITHNVGMWYIGSFISLCSAISSATCLFPSSTSKMKLRVISHCT